MQDGTAQAMHPLWGSKYPFYKMGITNTVRLQWDLSLSKHLGECTVLYKSWEDRGHANLAEEHLTSAQKPSLPSCLHPPRPRCSSSHSLKSLPSKSQNSKCTDTQTPRGWKEKGGHVTISTPCLDRPQFSLYKSQVTHKPTKRGRDGGLNQPLCPLWLSALSSLMPNLNRTEARQRLVLGRERLYAF